MTDQKPLPNLFMLYASHEDLESESNKYRSRIYVELCSEKSTLYDVPYILASRIEALRIVLLERMRLVKGREDIAAEDIYYECADELEQLLKGADE